MRYYTSRTAAIQAEIVEPLGEFAAAHNIAAIADEAIVNIGPVGDALYTCKHNKETDEFWDIVVRHALPEITARLAVINEYDHETCKHWDTVRLEADGELLDEIFVESNEEREPYDAAVQEALQKHFDVDQDVLYTWEEGAL